jgi:hypothetical protein
MSKAMACSHTFRTLGLSGFPHSLALQARASAIGSMPSSMLGMSRYSRLMATQRVKNRGMGAAYLKLVQLLHACMVTAVHVLYHYKKFNCATFLLYIWASIALLSVELCFREYS